MDINRKPSPNIYQLFLSQEWPDVLHTNRREYLVVIGKGDNDQTVIYYKVAEFQKLVSANIGDLVTLNGPKVEWIPVHLARMQMMEVQNQQVRDGITLMENKIKAAIQ